MSPVSRTRGLVAALAAATLVLVAAGCGGEDTPTTLSRFDQPLDVSAVALPDVSPAGRGEAVPMGAAPGGLQLVFFGYTTCPDICPTTLARIRAVRRALAPAEASRLSVAFVTVDLARDTPARLNGYLGSFLPRYRAFRATSAAELATAERAFKAAHTIARGKDGTVEVSHTSVLYVVDDSARAVAMFRYGTDPEDMTTDVRRLLDDAGEQS